MNLKEYESRTEEKWQNSMLVIAAYVCIIALIVEIIIFAILKFSGGFDTSESGYLVIRVILPTLFNIIMVALMYYVKNNTSNERVVKNKNDLLCMALYAMFTVIAIVHNYYHVTWAIPVLCQFINSIYADKAGIKRNYKYINIVLAIVIIFAVIERAYEYEYLFVSAICAYAFAYVIYTVANLLVKYNHEQLEYMRANYERQKQLIDELNIESMTGIYNRNSLEEKIQSVINENMKLNTFLVLIDLDYFKRINDIYGHTYGDDVIMRLVAHIRNIIGHDVSAFRYGGEEFIIFFRNTPINTVIEIINKMRVAFSNEKFDFDSNITMTFSAGIARYNEGMSSEDLILTADKALYSAKENGRNQIFYIENQEEEQAEEQKED